MQFDLSQIPGKLISYVVLVFSLTVHECAHAWAAWRMGDPTAKRQGRLTLNPLVHMDPIGTVLFPLLSMFSGIPLLGWANPVPVDPGNLSNPRKGHAVVAALGPLSNLGASLVFSILLKVLFLARDSGVAGSDWFSFVFKPLGYLLLMGVIINVSLALFNLVPVPPLDGGWIFEGILPESAARSFRSLRPYGFILLLVLFYTGAFGYVLWPILAVFEQVVLIGLLGLRDLRVLAL